MQSATLPRPAKALVAQELDLFYGDSLRAALRATDLQYSHGDGPDGHDVSCIVAIPAPSSFDMRVIVLTTEDHAAESGTVHAYGPDGVAVVLDALARFTEAYGDPATFTVVLNGEADSMPRAFRDTTLKMV